jgi:hypothetical protein
MRGAVDQRSADPFFKRANTAAEGRLRNIARLGGARKTSIFKNGKKILEPRDFHFGGPYERHSTVERNEKRCEALSYVIQLIRISTRLPKMMTAGTIIAGLVPILWSTGTGSKMMQRIALPMIGGMISSTALTLLVISAIYGSSNMGFSVNAEIILMGEKGEQELLQRGRRIRWETASLT